LAFFNGIVFDAELHLRANGNKNMKDNIAVVQRLYEARGNPEIVRQVLASDVRWEVVEGFPYSDVYAGLEGVFDFFTRLFSDFDDWHSEPSEFFETGDRVIAIGTYSARAKATGKSFKARFAHVWTLRNGLIIRLQQCADTVQIAKALGKDFGKRK
jgi:ketosteroid isomerase-like protein